jgi:hypothetical protein
MPHRPRLRRCVDAALAWLLGFGVLATLNVLFHRVLAATFFFGALEGIILPASVARGGLVIADYALLAAANLYLLAPVGRVRGGVTGGLLGIVSFGTWNLVNAAFIPRWPVRIVVGDTAWHAVAGATAGLVMGHYLAWRTSAAR